MKSSILCYNSFINVYYAEFSDDEKATKKGKGGRFKMEDKDDESNEYLIENLS